MIQLIGERVSETLFAIYTHNMEVQYVCMSPLLVV